MSSQSETGPSQPHAEQLATAIRDKSCRVGVIGLGYVGLPLIRAFSQAGFATMGFDVDDAKIAKLTAGQSYIRHIPRHGSSSLCKAVRSFRPRICGDCRKPTWC
ncbi:MAG: NAD(P)-binding domain-containing protein [Pirellulaceae bacterium]